MALPILLTDDAYQDLNELHQYIRQHDSLASAEYVLTQLETALASLAEHPERGTFPKELLEAGLREYREIYFKPYRIIYRVINNNVYIMLIADGRRNMQTLLQRRLLR
ncbi:MAG: type II toxin-antitoxin system RelE/ParE family toxin [Idiomarina sp.]|nr:type II toxin-antitoxin system RelE/ParE family toxin [Idiomarina sp.]